MTQRNIDIMDRMADELVKGKKISEVLATFYSKRKVRVPYDEELFNMSVLDIGLPNRITNALMRNKLTSIEEVIQFRKTNSFGDVRSFGKQSAMQLLESILDLVWDRMDEERRFEFLVDFVESNEAYLKA